MHSCLKAFAVVKVAIFYYRSHLVANGRWGKIYHFLIPGRDIMFNFRWKYPLTTRVKWRHDQHAS